MWKKKVRTEEDLKREEEYREKAFVNAKRVNSWPEFEKRKTDMQEAARNTIKEKNIDTSTPISIKIPSNALAMFKKHAEEEWLKYQTKINQLIFKYNRNRLREI